MMKCFLLIVYFMMSIDKSIALSLSSLFHDFNVSKSIIIYSNNSRDFSDSVKVANQRCEQNCPDVVIRPKTADDISKIMRMVHVALTTYNTSIQISVKGGGHSYTCQAVKDNGILIDMRNFNNIQVSDSIVNVGAGLTFEKVFAVLKKNDRTIIHGQCLNVGVVGYTLHGGVHFGSLSNLYGLGSDNIVGLNMVLSNGSKVDIYTNNDKSVECLVDNVIGDVEECNSLFSGMKGAGSSFGLVTSLDLKLVKSSHLKTALTILTIDISNVVIADHVFQSYLSKFPSDMSVTFFGLDEYFKAYFFVVKFAKNKLEAVIKNNFKHLFKGYKGTSVHFIVEVSWVDSNEIPSYELPSVLQELSQDPLLAQFEILELRPWFVSSEPWSVPSYDLVWGSGHYYSGASITVDKEYTSNVVKTVFDSFSQLKAKKYCSDCVIVMYRVGEGLKRAHDQSSSFNSFIKQSHLWIEVDCGHFFRRQLMKKDWGHCSNFVDNLQSDFDNCTADESRMHYPNVPNLQTKNWSTQYYGKDNYERLQRTKSLWDPYNIFNHHQSIKPLDTSDNYQKFKSLTTNNDNCKQIYFNNGLKDFKTAMKVILGLSGFSLIMKKVIGFVKQIWSLMM